MAGILDFLSQAWNGGGDNGAPAPVAAPDASNAMTQGPGAAPAAAGGMQPAAPAPADNAAPQGLYHPNLFADPSGHFGVRNFLGNLGDALLTGTGHQAVYAPRIQAQQQANAVSRFLSDPNPIPSPDAIAQLAKFDPQMASSMYEKAQASRMAMIPKYTKDDSGNVWKEAVGQQPVLVVKGPGKMTEVGPGKIMEAINPYGLGGGDGSAPPEADTNAQGGANAPASTAAQAQQAPTGDEFAALIGKQYPGAQVTSGLRTAQRNAAVNGVANSAHLQDTASEWARDLALPQGADPQAAAAEINARGVPGLKAIYEGPGAANSTGPHLHVQYIAPNGAQQQPANGTTAAPAASQYARVLAQGPQEWRDLTPEEAARHPEATQVNAATGEMRNKPMSIMASQMPVDSGSVDYWAQVVAGGGTMPPLGMGAQAAALRQAILKRASEINTGKGLTGADQNALTAGYGANKGALGKITTLRSASESYENTMIQNIGLAKKMMGSGAGTYGAPVINRWTQYIRKEYGGDPQVAAFNTAIQTVKNEYAKIQSGSIGNSPVSDSSRREAEGMLDPNQTPQQIMANFEYMTKETGNRMRALRAQEGALRSGLSGKSDQPNIPGIRDNAQSASMPKGWKYLGAVKQ